MAVFLNGTYDEAYGLLVEARDYLAHREPQDRKALTADDRLVANCEAMRLTSRLTQVMAWLLLQKAVHAGEITRYEAAADHNRLSGQSVCRARDAAERSELPKRLRNLLERSYRLYTRVERLDALVAGTASLPRAATGAAPGVIAERATSAPGPGSAC